MSSQLLIDFPPAAIAAILFALLACAWIIRHGIKVGFQKKELRHLGTLVAKGDQAKVFGILFVAIGTGLAICIIVAIAIVAMSRLSS